MIFGAFVRRALFLLLVIEPRVCALFSIGSQLCGTAYQNASPALFRGQAQGTSSWNPVVFCSYFSRFPSNPMCGCANRRCQCCTCNPAPLPLLELDTLLLRFYSFSQHIHARWIMCPLTPPSKEVQGKSGIFQVLWSRHLYRRGAQIEMGLGRKPKGGGLARQRVYPEKRRGGTQACSGPV